MKGTDRSVGSSPSLGKLLALPTEPATEYEQWPHQQIHQKSTPTVPPSAVLGEVERRFVRAVIDNPSASSSALPKVLRISARRAIEIRSSLIERGFLRAHRVNTSARGRTAILLEPLPQALEALGISKPEASS